MYIRVKIQFSRPTSPMSGAPQPHLNGCHAGQHSAGAVSVPATVWWVWTECPRANRDSRKGPSPVFQQPAVLSGTHSFTQQALLNTAHHRARHSP